jgi:8-oxo-dGTP diphosphatase
MIEMRPNRASFRQSVVVMAWDDNGRVLVVTRGPGNRGAFGMPGGKVEAGESLEEAARRELHQETGLVAGPLVELYDGPSGDGIFWCTCFFASALSGDLRSSPEGDALWVLPEELRDAPPFATYNREALRAFALSMGEDPG